MVLGFDTSNYTTSVAFYDGIRGENRSRLLDVRQGELGLRQSDAVFAHVKRLPELADALFSCLEPSEITAIGVSTRPRAVEGSYMPCFLASARAKTAFIRSLPVNAAGGLPVWRDFLIYPSYSLRRMTERLWNWH